VVYSRRLIEASAKKSKRHAKVHLAPPGAVAELGALSRFIHRMEKKAIIPASHKEMIRQYPITGLVEGWYFRQEEVSAGCYLVEASDAYGRTISRQVVGDPETAMAECVEFARQVGQETTP
jgi:hypothetical protein